MKFFVLFFLVIHLTLSAQQQNPAGKFQSPESIKVFADWLYCGGDYLRASIEYEKYLTKEINDTVQLKLGLSYSSIQKNDLAVKSFKNISSSSLLYNSSYNEMIKNYFLLSDLDELKKQISVSPDNSTAKMFLYITLFSSGFINFTENEFVNSFPGKNKFDLISFYERKTNPGYKSPLLASCLSAILPGAGKFYTNRWGDGITALITTGLLTFLSANNFKADHQFRGWLFAGLGFFFYAGNVYGSAVSASVYNDETDMKFQQEFDEYIKSENYFIPKTDFCK